MGSCHSLVVRRRLQIGLGVVILALVVVIVWDRVSTRAPRYAGKPLTHWLKLLPTVSSQPQPQALEAIQHIGPNALPSLIRLVNARDSHLRLKLMDWADRFWPLSEIRFTLASSWQALGIAGFAALDEEVCRPAIPRLIQILNDPERSAGAADALCAIGPSGVLCLTNAINHPDNRVRLAVVTSIGHAVTGGPKYRDISKRDLVARTFVPVCLAFLHDQDSDVRGQAAQALGWFRREPDLVIPALAGLLEDSVYFARATACEALADFGTPAKAAIPALEKYGRQARSATEREMALKAIAQIEAARDNAPGAGQEQNPENATSYER